MAVNDDTFNANKLYVMLSYILLFLKRPIDCPIIVENRVSFVTNDIVYCLFNEIIPMVCVKCFNKVIKDLLSWRLTN